jgi:hypothetical protein
VVEPNTTIRKRASTAIGRIQTAAAQTSQGTEWCMSGVFQTNQPNGRQTMQRNVKLAVASLATTPNAAAGPPKILPTQFILTEGARNVLSYKVVERQAADAMSVIFVFPRTEEPSSAPWNQAALQCLAWKRPSDLWCHLPFLPPGDPEASPGNPRTLPAGLEAPPEAKTASAIHAPPSFIGSSEELGESFGRSPDRVDCSELWAALWRCVRPHQAAARGKRHLIVVVTDHIGKISGDSLISNVIGSRTSLQVISSISNPKVEDFCRQANGRLRTFENQAEIPELVQQAYLNLLTRYEISYQPVSPEATILKARVQTASGWGEVRIPIPRE